MSLNRVLFYIILNCLILISSPGFGEEVKKIQDNSFLIEEAYNQEDGVVQHIQMFQYLKKSKDWVYTFTQEWPVPKQTHHVPGDRELQPYS